MQAPQRIKTSLTFLLALMAIVLMLFIAENYFKLAKYKSTLGLLDQFHWIRVRNLTANSHIDFKPTKKDILESFQMDLKPYPATTDSFGFIVTDHNHPAPDLKFVFFGGSTTQCLYVDEYKRMPDGVRAAVEKKSGLKINVWNCAAGGTHSAHTLNVLNNMALNLTPDYAFFYGNVNDIAAMIHYGTFNNDNPEKGLFFNIETYKKMNDVDLNGLIPYTRNALKDRFGEKPARDDFADIRGKHFIMDSSRVMTPIARAYRTIIASCKANNIKPVLITERNNFDELDHQWITRNMPFWGPDPDEFNKIRKLFHQYNNLLRQIAKEEHVILIDLDGKPLDHNGYYDPVHFNNKGAMQVSELIATQFIEKASLKDKP